jgi:hypothetical protein
MGYKPSIVERMNRGLNFQKKNSLLKKSSPLLDTEPHTGEGGHSHAGSTAGSSTFSNVLPSGTRSTFQGSTTATFDPSTVNTQNHVTGKNYLESTDASRAAYEALSDEKKKKQDREALALQAKENLRVQNINDAIDVANQATLQQAEQEFQLNQQNQATSQRFTIGDATEAQEQQASMSEFETFNSELDAARTAALENAGDIFSKTYSQTIMSGRVPHAKIAASQQANKALREAAYFTEEDFIRKQSTHKDFFPDYNFQKGQQIQYAQGADSQLGTRIFDYDTELAGYDKYGGSRGYSADPTDLYGITEKYFDAKGQPIDRDRYYKLKKRGKDPKLELVYGPEAQKYFQQFQQ